MLARITRRTHDGRDLASWWCVACACTHEVPLGGGPDRWSFVGTLDEPTLLPTVIVTRRRGPEAPPLSTCHSRIKAGSIEYLPASTHELSGQTVAMEPA